MGTERKKTEPLDNKYVRLAKNSPSEECKLIGERVQRGELKWSYYAVDGDKGYHYYIILKN